MADKKISQLPAATTPLAGTEVLPIVQSGVTDQVSVANLTERRDVGAQNLTLSRFANYPNLSLRRAQGTYDVPTSIANGQILASWTASGYTNANDYRVGAQIYAQVSAAVSGDEIPTTLGFKTTADGASSPTTNLTISHTGDVTVNTGNLIIGTSGKGIDFSATNDGSGTMTSELLSDYEEGTWTPIIGGAGGESGQTYTYQYGSYEKIGRTVIARFDVRASVKGTITGNALIKGLPFTASGGNYGYISYWTNMASSIAFMSLQSNGADGAYLIGSLGAVTGLSYLQTANIANGIFLQGTIIYKV